MLYCLRQTQNIPTPPKKKEEANMARLSPFSRSLIVKSERKNRSGFLSRSIDREAYELEKLRITSSLLKGNEVVGGLLRFPVADGYAYYLVTNDKPLELTHINFGDNWTIPEWQIRGLRKSDIVSQLKRAREFSKIWKGSGGTTFPVAKPEPNPAPAPVALRRDTVGDVMGKCPDCGGELDYDGKNYGGGELELGYKWTCPKCGIAGTEWYNLTFTEHVVNR